MATRVQPDAASVARYRVDLTRVCGAPDPRILVAVSGGADSLALLLLTHAAIGDRCHAATVDHGLRAESVDEAAGVARLCADLGVPHTTLTAPLPARAGRTANVSARARLLRYRLLEEEAARLGARIATAHHADDQVETLVMRLNRGAGIAGLSGIRPRGGAIVRPLLGWRHADLVRLVAACGITAIDDPTNVDDRYDRARLRKVLADADWLDVAHWGASAAALGEADEALAWMTRRYACSHLAVEPKRAELRVDDLPAELVRRLVIRALDHVQPGIEPRGPQLAALMSALATGRRATIGDVVCTASTASEGAAVWRFAPAPPRRSL